MRVAVIGAGVAGLVAAIEFAERGARVDVFERSGALGERACSWSAGGMLAPLCESESAEPAIAALGRFALDWWPRYVPQTSRKGSLVLAMARDLAELHRFARRTDGFEWIGPERIAALEPDLAGRFQKGLYFPHEGHLEPRLALTILAERLAERGGAIHFGIEARSDRLEADRIIDCRGMAASDSLAELRGVRGEMIVVRSPELTLSRPVRLLHPRIPLYVVPRPDARFMIGATTIESADRGPITVRSAIELLSGAYALHPAFGEAHIVETGADARPAFPDNMPRIVKCGRVIHINGFYRHGFLLAPALARQAADAVFGSTSELPHENHRQWNRD